MDPHQLLVLFPEETTKVVQYRGTSEAIEFSLDLLNLNERERRQKASILRSLEQGEEQENAEGTVLPLDVHAQTTGAQKRVIKTAGHNGAVHYFRNESQMNARVVRPFVPVQATLIIFYPKDDEQLVTQNREFQDIAMDVDQPENCDTSPNFCQLISSGIATHIEQPQNISANKPIEGNRCGVRDIMLTSGHPEMQNVFAMAEGGLRTGEINCRTFEDCKRTFVNLSESL